MFQNKNNNEYNFKKVILKLVKDTSKFKNRSKYTYSFTGKFIILSYIKIAAVILKCMECTLLLHFGKLKFVTNITFSKMRHCIFHAIVKLQNLWLKDPIFFKFRENNNTVKLQNLGLI